MKKVSWRVKKKKEEKDKKKNWKEYDVGRRGEKIKEEEKKKNLVYLGLCYFGTVF